MKKLFLITSSILMLSTANLKAQITLQFTLDSVSIGGRFYCTDLGNNDYKYVFLDAEQNAFHLYNMNMTPYMTVHIPVVDDSIKNGFTVIYISKSLFDCDTTNIEYAYEKPVGDWAPFYVFRTDGTLLFKADSSKGPYAFGSYGGATDIRPIINTSDGTKLILIYHNILYNSGIRIYSLCGSLPTNSYDFSNNMQFVKIYPNPSAMQLNFEITPPNNQDEFEIVIFDNNAKEQKRESIALTYTKCTFDVSNMSSGTYFFSLISKTKVYQTGKFIITK